MIYYLKENGFYFFNFISMPSTIERKAEIFFSFFVVASFNVLHKYTNSVIRSKLKIDIPFN